MFISRQTNNPSSSEEMYLSNRISLNPLCRQNNKTPSQLLINKSKNELPKSSKCESKIIKYHNTKDFTFSTESKVPISEPLFEALPPIIYFSDYEALRVKTMVFKLRNKDSFSRRVKIIQPETNLFKISAYDEGGQESDFKEIERKIAPGLEISFLIKFAPETKKDYNHNLIVVTEREEFIVPIHAVAQKALIEFPDLINFGSKCPVKYASEKAVILHNRGEKSTKWELKLPEFFSVSKAEGSLDANSTEQVLIRFFPLKNKTYNAFGQLLYDGDIAEFQITGAAISGEVHLSQDKIVIEETYISLENKQTFKIFNKSSVKIDFEWRAFKSEIEEQEKKNKLLEQLAIEEDEKRRVVNEMIDLEDNIDNVDDSPFNNEPQHAGQVAENAESGKAKVAQKRKKGELMLQRKYRAIRKAVEEDNLLFEDEIFSIQPLNGSIWPNSEITITVVFKPKSALRYTNVSYCNISCSDERLVLNLEGDGLGPKAFLSTNVLSIGDIFVNEKQIFNMYIENRGEIPAKFALLKNKNSSEDVVMFETEEGVLAVGQRVNISVSFCNKRVGEYQEVFKWKLEGSTDLLILLVRGHVRTPLFLIDKDSIDFKKISFQFEDTQEFNLTNTSSVPFKFNFRVPLDGRGSSKEFEIIPATDTIEPSETKKIILKFVPNFRKVYNYSLVMDMENIGKDMKSIPITAEVEVPKVRLVNNVLDFGEIFLRYQQKREIELVNESKLFARFKVHQINQKFSVFGKVETDIEMGKIPPESSVKLQVSLTTECLKEFLIELSIEIISDITDIQDIKIKGFSKGPTVEISPKEIDFGEREVLQSHVKKVTLTNNSIIDADFYAFTKNQNSIFKPHIRHYVLKPAETFEVEITCLPDDAQKFQDTLFFIIKEGVDKEVKLKAKGVGSTIVSNDISKVDFGTIFTYRNKIEEVSIENKGRKTQVLKWIKKEETKNKKSENEKDSFDRRDGIFSIYPESIELLPKTKAFFQFKAFSQDTGRLGDIFCLTTMAVGDRKPTVLFNSTLEGSFIKPSINFSKKSLSFQYIWKKGEEPQPIVQTFEVTTSNPLPISFSLFIEGPFKITPENINLESNSKETLQLEFDPRKKEDLFSGILQEKLWIRYHKHPKNENFPLQAEFCYPNLSFDKEQIDFGAVMNETIKKVTLTISNPSLMAVEYNWFLMEDKNKIQQYNEPLNEIFDILPLRGCIEPGQSECVEFSYFALSNIKFELNAICKVFGGPEYSLPLLAEASSVAYNLSISKKNKTIDIGDAFLGQRTHHDFEIENCSKVVFDFSIRLDLSMQRAKMMSEFISFSPSKGTLSGGEKIKIRLSIAPGFPGPMHQILVIQIAHFEPEFIQVKGFGLFPSMRIWSKRKIDGDIETVFRQAWDQCKFDDIWRDLVREQVLGGEEIVNAETYTDELKVICNEIYVQVERILIKNYIRNSNERTNSATERQNNFVLNKKTSSMNNIQDADTNTKSKGFKAGDYKFFEELIMGTFSLNLGLIIAGNKASCSFKIENVGKCAITFGILLKTLKIQGLSFSTNKVHKLPFEKNQNSVVITVTYQTKKNQKTGKVFFEIPISVENSGKYILEISAYLTVPEIQFSTTEINCGKVLIGNSKKFYLRLENTKEVQCEWVAVLPQKIKKKKDDGPLYKFTLSELTGILEPGQKKTLEITFDPTEGKPVEEIITFTFKDSNKKLDLYCKGEGIWPNIEFIPAQLTFPPCLPQETLFQKIQVINHTEFELGIINPEQDVEYQSLQQILSELPNQSYRLPIQTINNPFWPEFKKETERLIEIKKLEKQIESLIKNQKEYDNQDQVEIFQKQIDVLKSQTPKKILKIPPKDQHHIILINRAINKLDDVIAKNLQMYTHKGNFPLQFIYESIAENQSASIKEIHVKISNKKAELAEILREREKKLKLKKPLPEFDEKSFLYLEKEEFRQIFNAVRQNSQFDAGCIFTNFETELISSDDLLSILNEELGLENISTYILHSNNEEQYHFESLKTDEVQDQEKIKDKATSRFINGSQLKRQLSRGNSNQNISAIFDEVLVTPYNDLEHPNKFSIELLNQYQQITNIKNLKMDINIESAFYALLDDVPTPKYPDISNQEIPQPEENQLIKKINSHKKFPSHFLFTVLTHKNENGILPDGLELSDENYLEYFNQHITRWIIPPKSHLELYIKFQNSQLGTFQQNLILENFSSLLACVERQFSLPIKAVTSYPNISRNIVNVYQRRKKNRGKDFIPNNEYIVNENLFDFGPILVQPVGVNKKSKNIAARHTTSFRLTNNSNYKIKISIGLLSELLENPEEKNNQEPIYNPFELHTREAYLDQGQTHELSVSCFPIAVGKIRDSIMVMVRDNPNPFQIQMIAEGILPLVVSNPTEVTFERVLVSKKVISQFQLQNKTLLESIWRITNIEKLEQSGFSFSKKSGILQIYSSDQIEVSYTTLNQEKKRSLAEIEIQDNKGFFVKMPECLSIPLNTESYHINLSFTGFQNNNELEINFGNTIVDFVLESSFGFKNDGIYPIKYDLSISNKAYENLFEIIPSSGTLAVGAQAQINLKFLSHKEITISSKSKEAQLILKIFEKDEVLNQIAIGLGAESQYTKYTFDPPKCLNFGPITFSETKVKTFELQNEGLFEYFYEFYDPSNSAATADVKKRFDAMKEEHNNQIAKNKGKFIPFKPSKIKTSDKITVGQFTISPASGLVPLNSSVKIDVIFKGSSLNFYENLIAIETSNRNPTESSTHIYNLLAESCVPVLEISNFRAIFEEQVVTQSLLSTGVNLQNIIAGNIYAIEDQTFYFGSVIPSKDNSLVTEKIKIINKSKVPASVKFEVTKKNGLFAFDVSPATAKINPHEFVYAKIMFKPDIMAQYDGIFKATVENSDPTIPGSSFSFFLKGEGTLPSLNITTGNNISILQNGENVLNMGRISLQKKKIVSFEIKNIGVIPATYKAVWQTPSQIFTIKSFAERSILPNEAYNFEIEVEGKIEGVFESKLLFTTFNNSFERNIVNVKSEIINELITIEGLNEEHQAIYFGDIILPPLQSANRSSRKEKISKQTILFKNNTNETVRMVSKKPDELNMFEIRPSIGHIPPKMVKKVNIYLIRPSTNVNANFNKEILFSFTQIQIKMKSQSLQKLINWDNQKFQRCMITEEEANWMNTCNEITRKYQEDKKQNSKLKEPVMPPKPIIPSDKVATVEIRDPVQEPEYDVLVPTAFEQKIPLIARIDDVKLEFDNKNFSFKPTNIMASRIVSFKVSNNSMLKVPIQFDFMEEDNMTTLKCPFEIMPKNIIINNNSSQEFAIRFAPISFEKIIKRRLVCRVLSPNVQTQYTLEVEGEVERPICHFELPYIISEVGEKIADIESIGINQKSTKRFYVYNPTPTGYEFIWSGSGQYIKCLNPKGIILPGKKYEMLFEFNPDANTPDKQDNHFIFYIKQFNLAEKFLFRTIIIQPKLFLSVPRIDFGPLLLGGKSKEIVYLKNMDSFPYTFTFTKTSLKEIGKEKQSSIKVTPLHGIIPSKKDIPIEIIFNPRLEKDFNYNLQISIPQKKENLSLNIKGQGYKLHHHVKINNCIVEFSKVQPINLGELFVHENRKAVIELTNIGDFNIDYLISKRPHQTVAIIPDNGTVRKGETCQAEVVYQSPNPITIKSLFTLQIVSGPSYQFEVNAISKIPLVEFSPKSIDFGEITIEKTIQSKVFHIEFINYDKKPLSIENDPSKNDCIEIQLPFGQSLLPFEDNKENKLQIPVVYKPKNEERFSDTLTFYINGRHKIEIPIKGETISNLYDLQNSQDQLIDFGILSIGQKSTKSIGIKNYSKNTIELNFNLENQIAILYNHGITLSKTSVSIPKKSSFQIEITFAPTCRLRQFSMPIKIQAVGQEKITDLFTVSSACFAEEIKLADDSLSFGSVVVNSYLTKKLQILNTGDLAAEFRWELSPAFLSIFNVIPMTGTVMPSEQINVDVTFSPKTILDYKFKGKFFANGAAKATNVVFSGKGISAPNSNIENIILETPVRTLVSKNVQLKNTTTNHWTLQPTINADDQSVLEYFTTKKRVDIAPNETANIAIEYLPLTSTPNSQNALLFIPLPDGSAKCYQIQGKVQMPKPSEIINLNFKAKVNHSHSITVVNWLAINQRFNVEFELANKDQPIKEGIIISSSNIMEIYPKSSLHFKFSIKSLKKGNFNLNLFFRNRINKEYLHYILNLTVEDTPILSTLYFNSIVREPKSQVFTIENPLLMPVYLTADKISIETKDVYIKNKLPLILQAQSEQTVELVYRPILVTKNQKSILKILTPELGNFYYELNLTSEKSTTIPTIYFKTSMGNDLFKTFTFKNYLSKQLPFAAKIEKINPETKQVMPGPADFFTDSPSINCPPSTDNNGFDCTMNIKFEASYAGESKALLTVSNVEGGEFNAYLSGISTNPLPKGPYKVGTKGISLEFKNVFFENKEFTFKFDNSCFSTTLKSPFKLDGKKTINIPISFKGAIENNGGRIIIDTKEQLTWVYYLEGSNQAII